jgi:hypothetical protein
MQRLHLIERVSSEKFLALLRVADVILHPFPFDGSRTSADGLIAGVPVLTLPSEYLRGRMGAAFLRTMNLPELVARSRMEYIQIAVKLAEDRPYYERIKSAIKDRLHLIWEDMEYVHSWAQFLCTAAGISPLNWDDFIRQTGRDLPHETALRDERRRNHELFDTVWGEETWLLEENGVALLESHLNVSQVPKIFNDWKSMVECPRLEELITNDNIAPIIATRIDMVMDQEIASASVSISQRVSLPSEINIQQGDTSQRVSLPSEINIQQGDTVSDNSPNNGGTPQEFDYDYHYYYSPEDKAVMDTVRQLAVTGRVEESHQLVQQLMEQNDKYKLNPLFLLDYGAIQYFRGEYKAAFDFCLRATQIEPRAMLAHGCVGVAGLYLDSKTEEDEAETLRAFVRAWELKDTPNPVVSSIFTLTQEAIEVNLVMALKTYHRYEECLAVATRIMDLPAVDQGGAYLIVYATVDWSQYRVPDLEALAERLIAQGQLQLQNDGRIFVEEIRRLQQTARHIQNPTVDCLTASPERQELTGQVVSTLLETVALSNIDKTQLNEADLKVDSSDSSSSSGGSLQDNGLVLIVQYFIAQNNNTELQNDVNSALVKNLFNSAISEIHVLTEAQYDFTSFPNNSKIKQTVIGRRLTFSEAFEYANRYLLGRTVILG